MSEVRGQTSEAEALNLEQLNGELGKLAGSIRTFSQEQVETWQQLPYLALQSDGNSGYSSFNRKLYEYGLLHVGGNAEGLYGTFVDCENGNILSQDGELDLDRAATDVQVVSAWLPDGRRFDAQSHIEQYRLSAVKPHTSLLHGEQQVREWRYDMAEKLGLLSVFSRTRPTT